jgi:hypothetical protein
MNAITIHSRAEMASALVEAMSTAPHRGDRQSQQSHMVEVLRHMETRTGKKLVLVDA